MTDPDALSKYGLAYNDEPLTALHTAHIAWMLRLCRERNVRHSLEIGFGLGISACALFDFGVANHVSIERYTDRVKIAEGNVAKVRKPEQKFRLLMGASDIHLPRLVDQKEMFDLILVDGGHRFDDVFIDVHYAARLLKPGGVMLIDDLWMSSTKAAVNWLDANMTRLWRGLQVPEDIVMNADWMEMACYERTDVRKDDDDGKRSFKEHAHFDT